MLESALNYDSLVSNPQSSTFVHVAKTGRLGTKALGNLQMYIPTLQNIFWINK